ncbi:MAG: hypothetical protein ACLQF4_13450 [Xanthobacteraceae bacterium]
MEPTRKQALADWLRDRSLAAPTAAQIEKQRRLFQIFTTYVTERGGWVTSPPGDKRVRFEVPQLNEIPIRLREKEIPLTYIGESTRVTSSNVALPVVIYQTKLG